MAAQFFKQVKLLNYFPWFDVGQWNSIDIN